MCRLISFILNRIPHYGVCRFHPHPQGGRRGPPSPWLPADQRHALPDGPSHDPLITPDQLWGIVGESLDPLYILVLLYSGKRRQVTYQVLKIWVIDVFIFYFVCSSSRTNLMYFNFINRRLPTRRDLILGRLRPFQFPQKGHLHWNDNNSKNNGLFLAIFILHS